MYSKSYRSVKRSCRPPFWIQVRWETADREFAPQWLRKSFARFFFFFFLARGKKMLYRFLTTTAIFLQISKLLLFWVGPPPPLSPNQSGVDVVLRWVSRLRTLERNLYSRTSRHRVEKRHVGLWWKDSASFLPTRTIASKGREYIIVINDLILK